MRCCGHHLQWDFLERRLSRLCCRYGHFVAQHPHPFIVLPLIFTCLLSAGWWFRSVSGDAFYLYTPQGAKSKLDQELIQNTFPYGDGWYAPGRSVVPSRECSIVVLAKDDGNILRLQHSEAVIRLNQFVMDKIEIKADNSTYTYRELCLKSGAYCYNNPHVYLVPNMYHNPDSFTNLSYPTASYRGQRFYLGSVLGGVRLDPSTGQVVAARAWILTYQLRFQNDKENQLSAMWELEYEQRVRNYTDPFVTFSFVHSQTLNKELARNANDLFPRFALMFNLLVFFAVLCTITFSTVKRDTIRRWPVIDWVLSRPSLALLGVIGAGMGVTSAIGALSYLGTPYPDIVSIMPFLIIAVRLDNTFLMLAALDNTKRTLPVEERIAEAMSESAVSITITVLTDVLSFACGVLTDFVAVQLFCVYTTVAIIITFCYQLTFVLGFIVLYAKWEELGRHALLPFVTTAPLDAYKDQSILRRLFCMGSRPAPEQKKPLENGIKNQNIANGVHQKPIQKTAVRRQYSDYVDYAHCEHENGTAVSRWFRDVYAPFLMSKWTQVFVVFVLLVFWAVSIYGCYNLRQGLEPVKLLVDDSYAIPHFRNMEKYFWKYGTPVQVIFMNPSDLTNAQNRRDILRVATEIANEEYAVGPDGLEFWLTSMDDYLLRTENRHLDDLPAQAFYAKLEEFLMKKENVRFRLDVIRRNTTWNTTVGNGEGNPVVAFRFLLGMRDFSTAVLQEKACDNFRASADRYPQYDVHVFNVMFLFADQYQEILPNVWQEIGSGMACMIGIALFLIPHPLCSIWVTVAIASIDLGVIGFMTLWGLNMDTISMITIIMSIGFSVDFSAHIAYAYVVNIDDDPTMRVRKALGTLGWPVLQGGIATLLGVVVLADLRSYMVVSFFKTVFLVIIFGLMHALVFLPVMLNGLTPTSTPLWLQKLLAAFRRTFSRKVREKQTNAVFPAENVVKNGHATSNGHAIPNGHATTNGQVIKNGHLPKDDGRVSNGKVAYGHVTKNRDRNQEREQQQISMIFSSRPTLCDNASQVTFYRTKPPDSDIDFSSLRRSDRMERRETHDPSKTVIIIGGFERQRIDNAHSKRKPDQRSSPAVVEA